MHRPRTSQATHALDRAYGVRKQLVAVIMFTALVVAYTTVRVAYSHAFFDTNVSARQLFLGTSISDNSQTLPLLQAARNIDPTPARGGGDIIVANGTALVPDASPFKDGTMGDAKGASSDQISLYLVREGDTLSQVATMFNVSVSTIVWANQLSSNKDIHPGQTLLVLPVSGVQYIVQKGDTIRDVANRYGGDVGEIIAFNNLSADGTLTTNAVITIPGGEAPAEIPKATTKKAKTTPSTHSTSASAGTGYYTHPLPGSIRTQGTHGYNGVDFGAPAGTPIHAAASGVVIVSREDGWNGGYGNYVVIKHQNDTQTLYAHMTSTAASEGQHVTQGQVIGYVGNTGRSTGYHLHFEIRGAKNPFGE
jgi:LysM repeat protein